MQADLRRSGLPLSVTADDGGQITHPETTPNLSCQISSGFIEFGPEPFRHRWRHRQVVRGRPFPMGRKRPHHVEQGIHHLVRQLASSRGKAPRWWHPLGFGHGHCPQPPFRQDVPGSTP